MPALTPRAAALVQYPRPEWTSPTAGSTVTPTEPLVWKSVARTTATHFYVETSTASNFTSPDTYRSDRGGFEYYDGAAWQPLPYTGLPSIYASTILATSGLTAYWRLGESSGNLTDSGPNGNTLTMSGTPTYSATGIIANDANTAITFNGSNTYATKSGTITTAVDNWTLEAWFNFSGTATKCVVYNGCDTGGKGYGMYVDSASKLSGYGEGAGQLYLSTNALTGGVWVHAVITRRSGTTYGYINGARLAGTNATLAPVTPAGYSAVGCERTNATTYSFPFNGTIDEVAIYNVSLTDEQIADHYNKGKATVGTSVRLSTTLPTAAPLYARVRQSK